MDIWEANSAAAAFTPHPCKTEGVYRCSGDECGNTDRYGGLCDKDGCDYNSYRMGAQKFLGPGLTIDTNSKFTVVTQFLTDDNTSTGKLVEIRRLYVQNGTVIQNSKVNVPGLDPQENSITDNFCLAQKAVFDAPNDFAAKGGLTEMGNALGRGMVLAMSIWDDGGSYMLWLDGVTPTDADPATPGVARGPCSADSGRPEDNAAKYPDAAVTFSNIKSGDIGSTFSAKNSTIVGRHIRH